MSTDSNFLHLGTLSGVVAVAALAWYGGRASLNHRIKNGGTNSVWNIPRPRSGKFFSRGSRGTTEFTPVTPSTPAWQTAAYGGAISPNAEAQQQFPHQGWQMAKKEPGVTVNETATPDPTYISIGDDYGWPSPETGGTVPMRYHTESQSQTAKYERVSAGQPEGLRLLRGDARPVIQRKEVSRKPVPGRGNGSGSL